MSHLDDNRWLSARIFGLAQRAQTDLVQVARYLTEDPLREKIQARVEELLDRNSDLIIAHSLGSIVGWEAGHGHKSALPMLLTIGSPLGLDSIVYPRLRPFPPTFPRAVCRWVNIAHPDDIIAVEPRLRPLFPSSDNRKVEDHAPTSPRNHHAGRGLSGTRRDRARPLVMHSLIQPKTLRRHSKRNAVGQQPLRHEGVQCQPQRSHINRPYIHGLTIASLQRSSRSAATHAHSPDFLIEVPPSE